MGWMGYHIYGFDVKYKTISETEKTRSWLDDAMNTPEDLEATETMIADFFIKQGDYGTYTYDYRNGWVHRVTLSKILPAKVGVEYPIVIGGKRACPPEGEID